MWPQPRGCERERYRHRWEQRGLLRAFHRTLLAGRGHSQGASYTPPRRSPTRLLFWTSRGKLLCALKASLEIISLTRSRGAAIAIAGARADCLSEATAIGALSALLGNALHLRRASPHSTEGGAAFETDQAIVAVTVLAAPISAVSFSTTTEDEQHESNGQGNNTTPTITLAVHYSPFLSPKWKLLSTGQAQRQTSTRYTGSIATDKRTVHCEQQPRHT
jgi:hypothetical protein